MGAVHGVYLKYVALSAASYVGYSLCYSTANADQDVQREVSTSSVNYYGQYTFLYSCALNGAIAVMFKLRRGMGLLGKNSKTGQIPLWSYIVYFPFHLPTLLYTYLHFKKDQKKKLPVPPASEVLPGWWVGGCYGHLLDKKWGGVIDLTSEFPETCINSTEGYLLVASWDGVPPPPAKLDEAALFASESIMKGPVLVHCAHGRGRSTTVMCASLVKAGLCSKWEDALKVIQKGRSVCKLNSSMRKALSEWQDTYVDSKKSI